MSEEVDSKHFELSPSDYMNPLYDRSMDTKENDSSTVTISETTTQRENQNGSRLQNVKSNARSSPVTANESIQRCCPPVNCPEKIVC